MMTPRRRDEIKESIPAATIFQPKKETFNLSPYAFIFAFRASVSTETEQRIAERVPLRVHICYSCRRLVNVRQLRNVLILVLLNQYADDFHKRCERM